MPLQRAGETACPTKAIYLQPFADQFESSLPGRWGRRFRLPEFCNYLEIARWNDDTGG
jgi:hypothetical protein